MMNDNQNANIQKIVEIANNTRDKLYSTFRSLNEKCIEGVERFSTSINKIYGGDDKDV